MTAAPLPLVALVAVADAIFAIDKPYDYAIPAVMREAIQPGCRVTVPFGQGNRRCEGFVLSLKDGSQYAKLKSIYALLDEAPVLDSDGLKLALWLRERVYCTFYEAARSMLPAGLWHVFSDRVVLAPGLDRGEAEAALAQFPEALLVLEALIASGGSGAYDELEAIVGAKKLPKVIKTLTDKGLATSEKSARRRVGDKTLRQARLAVPPEDAMAIAEGKSRSAPMQKAVLKLLSEIGEASVREICYFTGASPVVLTNLARLGLVSLVEQEVFRRPAAKPKPAGPIRLNQEQQVAFDRVRAMLDGGKPACALLHGVTGSGKTSVYLELIRHVLDMGGGAIVMVPEIVLTPQLMAQFAGVFGDRVALLHSGLTLGERYDEWKRIRSGAATVVLGTRSAVFAPLRDIRLIVLDEEQEYTYKSENTPRYHAREVAKYRIRRSGVLLLGSATPSVESAYFAATGLYEKLTMRVRYNENALPAVFLADLRRELAEGNPTCISALLRAEIESNLASGQQSILFLNRRGHNRFLVCESCGEVPQCHRCSVTLTFHSANGRLMCHQCGHSEKKSDRCPHCGGVFRPEGIGTQKVESDLRALFPDTQVLRMDTDTTGGRGAHEALLSRFREQRIPILIGTQMVTKGLDFPNVTLVGVLDADMALYMNDFRAHERAFGLITQVVGRAGRGDKPGRAVIQTFTPGHPVLKAAAAQDYGDFYENEIALRSQSGLPPFNDFVLLSLSGLNQDNVQQACLRLRRQLEQSGGLFAQLLGPAPATILKVNNRYRYQITLIARMDKAVRSYLSQLLAAFETNRQNRGVHLFVDINPY